MDRIIRLKESLQVDDPTSAEALKILIDACQIAVNRLCQDCRQGVPINQADGHGFDIHARECSAAFLRAALAKAAQSEEGR